jgi:hypothetical protein
MLQVKINGTPIQGRIEGLEDFTLNYSRDSETGRTQKSYTNQLKFYDDAFAIIYPLMVANPNGLNQSANVEIWDDCCNAPVYRDLIIRGDMVDFCTGDCFVTARLTRQDPDELIYQCLNKYEISSNKNGYFNYPYTDPITGQTNANPRFPLVVYCNELRPNWLMAVLLEICFILLFIGTAIWPALALIFTFISLFQIGICLILKKLEFIVNLIPGVNEDLTPPFCDQVFQDPFHLFKEYDDLLDRLAQSFIGCGRKHPTPLYRQYVENACQICGINQFNSSILNDPNSEYYNALYFNAPADAGSRSAVGYISENRPIATMSVWLDTIAKDFNARWWISQGQLYFERKDFYLSQPPIYDADINQETGDILDGVCFTYNEGKLFSSIKIEATMDALDDVGNEDRNRYTVYFDYGANPNWEGANKKVLSYSPARFRNDGIEPDIITNYGNRPLANFIFQGNLSNFSRALLMAKGTASNPKMLIWDGQSYTDAYVKIYNGVQNMPAMVNSGQSDLYDKFHRIDDPNINPFRFWNAELTVRANCQLVQQLDVNRTVRLRTPYGAIVNARINQINANLGERTIQFTCEF